MADAKPPKPKTHPRIEAVKPGPSPTPAVDPGDINLNFSAKGFKLNLGQAAAATAARWAFRILVLALLGYLSLTKTDQGEITEKIETRVAKLETNLNKILLKMEITPEP